MMRGGPFFVMHNIIFTRKNCISYIAWFKALLMQAMVPGLRFCNSGNAAWFNILLMQAMVPGLRFC